MACSHCSKKFNVTDVQVDKIAVVEGRQDSCLNIKRQGNVGPPKRKKKRISSGKQSTGSAVQKCESNQVPIADALSLIFECVPEPGKFLDSVNPKVFWELSCDKYSMCEQCAHSLGNLYKAYREFSELCKVNSMICKKFRELKELRMLDVLYPIPDKQENKKPIEGKKAKGNRKKAAEIIPRKARVKSEPEEIIPDSPPDSPVGLSRDENVPPRSPRPRRNAAKKKNWAKVFDDDSFFSESELKIENKPISDSEDLLLDSNILIKEEYEIDETEHSDFFLDDNDDDYNPESDLEELNNKIQERKRNYDSCEVRNSKTADDGGFECEFCGKLYAHEQSLDRHLKFHSSDQERLVCPVCKDTFLRTDHLIRHRRLVHHEIIPHRKSKDEDDGYHSTANYVHAECPICSVLINVDDIQEHVDEHGVEKPFKCSMCPETFSFYNDLRNHKLAHTRQTSVKCSVCDKTFRNSFFLTKHQLKIHHVSSEAEIKPEEDGSEINGFPCDECDKVFHNEDKLKTHQIFHGIGERITCEICGRQFTFKSSKNRHMLLHKEISDSLTLNFVCSQPNCGKVYLRKEHLKRHLLSAHNISSMQEDSYPGVHSVILKQNPKDKELQCSFCGKLVKRERLRLHMVSHTGERKHKCEHCGMKFGLRSTLLTHVQCVHKGVRRYKCQYCEAAFKRSNHLKDHERLHTHADHKPFKCSYEGCDKAFRRLKNLKSHLVCHEGNQDFMCDICGKKFNRIDNMRAHVKSVHEGLSIRRKKSPTRSQKKSPSWDSMMTEESQLKIDLDVNAEEIVKTSAEIVDTGTSLVLVESSELPTLRPVKVKGKGKGSTTPKRKNPKTPRASKARKQPISALEATQESTIVVPTNDDGSSVLPPGTIVTLAVDTSNMLTATDEMQIQEYQEVSHEEQVKTFDSQRTTFVQIAPGQVFATADGNSTSGNNIYYQYTLYHS